VVEAARLGLEGYGVEAASTSTIMARSGLSTTAACGYFEGKDEMIKAARGGFCIGQRARGSVGPGEVPRHSNLRPRSGRETPVRCLCPVHEARRSAFQCWRRPICPFTIVDPMTAPTGAVLWRDDECCMMPGRPFSTPSLTRSD
jgi:hypothetical protein